MPIPRIRLSIDELSKRGTIVQGMLAAITPNHGPAFEQRTSSTTFKIGTHNGSRTGSQVSDWYFNTSYRGILAQYYEYWEKFDDNGEESWFLERAYFHICRANEARGKPDEIVLLHCDPSFDPSDGVLPGSDALKRRTKQAPYKTSLHLHIVEAKAPFPHAHIALHLGFANQVMESIDSLSNAVTTAIGMLQDEILDEMDVVGL